MARKNETAPAPQSDVNNEIPHTGTATDTGGNALTFNSGGVMTAGNGESKKKRVIRVTISDDNSRMLFEVGAAGEFSLALSDLPADILAFAACHGLKQKISDGAAIPVDDNGNPATDATKLAAMLAIVENLRAGDWSKRGEGTGEGKVPGVIFRALLAYATERAGGNFSPDDAAALRAKYDAYDMAGKRKVAAIPRVAEIMAEIKAASAKPVAVDAMLADLGI